MCGGRATSAEQFGQSKIDLHSGSTGSAKNELKRPREVTSSSKPPLPPKKLKMVPPPPSKSTCTTVTGAADIISDFASGSNAPPGVFDFPRPAAMFDIGEFYDVFFRSLIDGVTPSKPIVLEGFRPFDEIMDPEMEHIWLPILRQPLIPIVYKQRGFRF
ncbi:hypothetical protein FCM35_KLT05102 [Carex littledalei]|uniref:Uncharacterized protein n=1 Tax=Carex littledalei TaxID=544730 RepID=A0A833V9H1_9POAL|nr:hypothetical protein FCM35_KLT05102 [Carex littledalei]